jgi:hypothetical protein
MVMKNSLGLTCFIVLLAASGGLVSGCTIVFGALAGSTGGKQMASDLQPFEEGTQVKASLKSGDVVKGRYVGAQDVLDAAYYARYSEAILAAPVDVRLPARGERLDLVMHPDSWLLGLSFLGFGGYGRTYLIAEGASGVPHHLPLERIVNVRGSSGFETSGLEWRRLAFRGGLPSGTHLVLVEGDNRRLVSGDDVVTVRTSGDSARYVAIGALAGLLVDVYVMPRVFCPGGYLSC